MVTPEPEPADGFVAQLDRIGHLDFPVRCILCRQRDRHEAKHAAHVRVTCCGATEVAPVCSCCLGALARDSGKPHTRGRCAACRTTPVVLVLERAERL